MTLIQHSPLYQIQTYSKSNLKSNFCNEAFISKSECLSSRFRSYIMVFFFFTLLFWQNHRNNYIGKALKGKSPHTWHFWSIKIPKLPYISSLKSPCIRSALLWAFLSRFWGYFLLPMCPKYFPSFWAQIANQNQPNIWYPINMKIFEFIHISR